jgi:uncharacterized protein (TIGR00299 family) protein
MRIAYLDTIAGIAGDMTMAAFVAAGVSFDALSTELRKLGIEGFELAAHHVQRNSIHAVHIDVVISHQPHYHRHLKDIRAIIDASTLSTGVKEKAQAVFSVIAEAEAKVHNTVPEKVHFHEVGALDSIVDIVGTALCLELAGIERVYSSPVKLGSGGLITTQHGIMPSPAPATLEILKDYPTLLTTIPHELTTPTGAAIVKALSYGVLGDDLLHVKSVGYGAGTKEFPEVPNFLRVVIADRDAELEQEDVTVIETNIDDMNPQLYPYVIEQLLAAGAHDVYLVPIIMKKGRPGILLSVMVHTSKLDAAIQWIYRETSTIGLRLHHIGRKKLPRRHLEVQTSFGTVSAKAVIRDGREIVSPEFEECKRIAQEKHMPVLEVMRAIEREISSHRT